MKLLPYPEYKDSGVLWLGKIPKHWESYRLKYLAKINPTVDRKAEKPRTASFVPMATIRENYPWFTAEERHYFELEKGFTNFCDGDVLIAKITPCFENGKGGICRNLKNGIGFGSTEFHVVRPGSKLLTTYIYYLTITRNFRYFGKKHMQGSAGQQRVPTELIKNIQIGVPPYNEQTQIARFLDWKTAQINKFIRNKRRLIELLKEQKQNVINQAVTRGLDPKVKFKPSGVEWIGDIPEHWEVRRLKFLARIRNGQDYKEVEAESGYPVMGSGGQFAYSSAFMYEGESVLFGRKGTIDKPLYINGRFWTVDTMFYTEVSKLVSAKFLYFSALSFPFDYYSTKTALPSMTQQDLGNHPVALPPRDEQELIIQYIEEESQLIDQTISRAQREMDLMREYRTRLISDVVTGQVDVRNVKCEGGSLNEDEFEDIEEVEEEIELPEGGEDDE